jgi:tRNA1(Val) A37 N6-methylase TrmN6
MASTSLRFEDRLDVASNLLSSKGRVTLILEENVSEILSRTLLFRLQIRRSW